MPVTVGVPQGREGAIIGPFLFITSVNDMPESEKRRSTDLYADDTTMKTAHHQSTVMEERLNEGLASLTAWLPRNRLITDVDKTVCMLIGRRREWLRYHRQCLAFT